MEYKIKIANLNFEGPFDLLLHLLKKNEMDIYNIRIYEITNQYMDYLNQMKEIDLEITSEFIVIAATLLEIKSKMLLPKTDIKEQDELENDPRKQLVEKLIEYKKFKSAAQFFKEKFQTLGMVFSKKPEIIDDTLLKKDNEDVLKNITMLQLYNIFNEIMNNYRNRINENNTLQTQIPVDQFRIEDKMVELSTRISAGKKYKFTEIIHKYTNKMEIVVTFLALLELIRMRNVIVFQDGSFKEIFIERVTTDG